jgi:hypothetical protein
MIKLHEMQTSFDSKKLKSSLEWTLNVCRKKGIEMMSKNLGRIRGYYHIFMLGLNREYPRQILLWVYKDGSGHYALFW